MERHSKVEVDMEMGMELIMAAVLGMEGTATQGTATRDMEETRTEIMDTITVDTTLEAAMALVNMEQTMANMVTFQF